LEIKENKENEEMVEIVGEEDEMVAIEEESPRRLICSPVVFLLKQTN
jgi:hypothetical protein